MSLAQGSPRLPSPPPAAEIQIGPNSPAGEPTATLETTEIEQSHLDANSGRRIHPGTRSCDMAAGPPLVPLNELDSPFQLQEHLAALHYHYTKTGTEALTREAAIDLATPPMGIDRTLWLYELCRFLISQCNSLIIGFLFDTPPCSANTCPEMRASEWQFLCAVHEQPKSCCAIDYCCHTLDWAANVVSDQRIFPSRFVVVSDLLSKNVGVKSLVNVFRRLHRIFAHAWFQHRLVFWSVEGQTGLYLFFKTVCDLYDLLPAENYKLPPEAEGLETPPAEAELEKAPTILKPSVRASAPEDDNVHASIGRTSTRRHIRSSPSTGSSVTTVLESDEEDARGVSRRMRNMQILPPSTVQEESESAEVPVIVEQGMFDGPPPPLRRDLFDPPPDSTLEETEARSGEAPGSAQSPSERLDIPESAMEAPLKPAEDEPVAASGETAVASDQDTHTDTDPILAEDTQQDESSQSASGATSDETEPATSKDESIDHPAESPAEGESATTNGSAEPES